MLGLGNSLVNSSVSSWAPSDESSLVAWYQYQTGISLNGSDVEAWEDYTKAYNMVQATAANQPAYSDGTLTFDNADTQFLQTSGQISLTGDFTIGFRAQPIASPQFIGAVLGDNTIGGEFVRFTSATGIRVTIDGAQSNFSIDAAGDDYYVLTRSGSDINLRQNGVLNVTTGTSSATVYIDAIGVRRTNLSPFNGTMKEIQIYESTNTALTANVNSRLASL